MIAKDNNYIKSCLYILFISFLFQLNKYKTKKGDIFNYFNLFESVLIKKLNYLVETKVILFSR